MKTRKKWWMVLASIPLIGSFLYYQNHAITTSEYTIASNRLPASFHDFTIVQLSDVHSASFGERQEHLLVKVKEATPDIVVLTGDLVDARRYDEAPSLLLARELVKIAPVYYVTGNHEWRTGVYPAFEKQLKAAGVTVLRNETVPLERENQSILLHGVDDPSASAGELPEGVLEHALQSVAGSENYQILLAHRPEYFPLYTAYDFDLVFSGHAHGGQMRLPFVGGLFAPHQGFLPKLTEGVHTQNRTSLVVSRGLGNSLFPYRIFNRPEVVVTRLQSKP